MRVQRERNRRGRDNHVMGQQTFAAVDLAGDLGGDDGGPAAASCGRCSNPRPAALASWHVYTGDGGASVRAWLCASCAELFAQWRELRFSCGLGGDADREAWDRWTVDDWSVEEAAALDRDATTGGDPRLAIQVNGCEELHAALLDAGVRPGARPGPGASALGVKLARRAREVIREELRAVRPRR